MSSMFCTKIYNCKNADWCARDFNPKSEKPKCFEQLTHYDRIHAMNEEQLADQFIENGVFLCPVHNSDCLNVDCRECFLGWLKQEASDGQHRSL